MSELYRMAQAFFLKCRLCVGSRITAVAGRATQEKRVAGFERPVGSECVGNQAPYEIGG